MPILVVFGVFVVWAIFGSPSQTIANLLWDDSPAPWESVEAFYYPDRNNLSRVESSGELNSIEECRDWVSIAASRNNDDQIRRGDYECGVGYLEDFGGVGVYRLTVR